MLQMCRVALYDAGDALCDKIEALWRYIRASLETLTPMIGFSHSIERLLEGSS